MRFPSRNLPFLIPLCSISTVLADLLGPSYPAPTDVSSNSSLVPAGWRNVSSTIQTYLTSSGAIADAVKNVTFSIGMFSVHDPAAITNFQFHYTSPEIAQSTNGTHSVDADSIYHIASVSKLFTVLAGLRELNSTEWERPLTDIFPSIAAYAANLSDADGPIYTVQWDKITPSALAAQIAGVPRDGFPSNNELGLLGPGATAFGFPLLSASDPLSDPPCVDTVTANGTCPPLDYIEGITNRAPTFLPWSQPAYANNGFSLLGLALEAMTGKPFEQIYSESIFLPLGMSSSFSFTPPTTEWYRCVIPGDLAANLLDDIEVFVASGGLFSTTSDLARFGVGILNSTLLALEETRRWMKPVSHTTRLRYSVGRPWEIVRFTLPGTGGKVTDLYTKLGDSGNYSAYMILLPDYGAGFSIMAASTSPERFDVVARLVDIIVGAVVPALEAQAATEAETNFAGTYAPPVLSYPYNTVPAASLNSSLTLALNRTDGAAPGLVITSWVSNGTDVLSTLPALTGGNAPYRLVPSIADTKDGTAAFRLITALDAPDAETPAEGLFAPIELQDWVNVDAPTYGGIGTSLLVFDIGSDGKASAVSPAAYRVKLSRSE